jgi:hypothetical protein
MQILLLLSAETKARNLARCQSALVLLQGVILALLIEPHDLDGNFVWPISVVGEDSCSWKLGPVVSRCESNPSGGMYLQLRYWGPPMKSDVKCSLMSGKELQCKDA